MSDIVFKSALEQAQLLKKKKLSAVELLGECLTQYARHNERINAVILTDLSRGRAAAAAADKRLANGEALSPFDGVPMTAKESFDWSGHPSTWGDPALIDNIPSKNAVALQRMLDAGAVMYGKTNVPLALADWQSFNAVYGTTNNPWDVTRTPGGSSGGAAAALATGMTALEMAPTSALPSAIPRIIAVSSATSRPMAWCPIAAISCPAASRSATSRWLAPWRARRKT
jgi:amidase